MICAQIGESTLNVYFVRLEEGFDCEDSLYSLWKQYYREIVSQSAIVNPMKSSESDHQIKQSKDPLALPTIRKGTVKRKVQQLPPLISGNQFIEHLVTREKEENGERGEGKKGAKKTGHGEK